MGRRRSEQTIRTEGLRFESGHHTAVGDGFGEGEVTEAGGGEEGFQLGGRVAFAFGDAHQERGVGGDGERAGFVGVEVRVVNHEESAGRERGEAGGEEGADFGDVPVVEDVGKKVDVVVARERVGEHVAGDDGDAGGVAAFFNHAAGDAVDGWAFEDGGGEVWMVSGDGAGVDAGAAGNIEEARAAGGGDFLRERGAERKTAAIHRGGKRGGERVGEHRFGPGFFVLVARPIGRAVGAEDRDEVLHDGTLFR